MPNKDRNLRNPKTWLAALVSIAAIVGFGWNGTTSEPGGRRANISQQAQGLMGPGSSGATNGEAQR